MKNGTTQNEPAGQLAFSRKQKTYRLDFTISEELNEFLELYSAQLNVDKSKLLRDIIQSS